MESSDALHDFRRSFYECFHRRRGALFELADAILSADGGVPSPPHLSLQASHRRGWGSLYAALDRGRIDAESSIDWRFTASDARIKRLYPETVEGSSYDPNPS
jgi:hypothetical protein